MHLYHIIDSGNTNLKLTSFNKLGDVIKHHQNLSSTQLQDLVDSILLKKENIASCSVNLEIDGVEDFNLLKSTLDFRTNYSSTLGSDRLALCYYIQNMQPRGDITIINMGTFTTVDYISNGVHLGGNIFLGPQTYLDSYATHGKYLPKLKLEDFSNNKEISTNTNNAIFKTLDIYMLEIFKSAKGNIYLTGGASKFFRIEDIIFDELLLAKALFHIFVNSFWKITN